MRLKTYYIIDIKTYLAIFGHQHWVIIIQYLVKTSYKTLYALCAILPYHMKMLEKPDRKGCFWVDRGCTNISHFNKPDRICLTFTE